MSEGFDRGEPDTYEILWKTGHVDRVVAHQVSWPDTSLFGKPSPEADNPRVRFHGEIDGHWRLMLEARESDILSIRNVTQVGDSAS